MLFAGSAFLVMMTIGLAIDGARAYNASLRVASALDSAALAAAKMLDDEDSSEADIQERARRFFAANFAAQSGLEASVDVPQVVVSRATQEVDITVNVSVPTTFGQVAGIATFDFPRSVHVRYDQKRIELAMVLDVTGSMCSPCDKIDGLKAAATAVANNLLGPQMPNGFVKVGLVPYSASVNAGPMAATVSGGTSTDGCVVERSGPNQSTDAPASGLDVLGTASTAANAAYRCPSSQIMPLTADKALLEARIASLDTGGGTAGHIGLGWGWYMVSRRWQGLWPLASQPRAPAANVIKAVLLMTDGEFNTSYIAGAGMNSTDVGIADSSPEQASRLCANMKAAGIVVFTVAYQAPSEAEALLRQCASTSGHFFPAENASQMLAAFGSISEMLVSLRLTR